MGLFDLFGKGAKGKDAKQQTPAQGSDANFLKQGVPAEDTDEWRKAEEELRLINEMAQEIAARGDSDGESPRNSEELSESGDDVGLTEALQMSKQDSGNEDDADLQMALKDSLKPQFAGGGGEPDNGLRQALLESQNDAPWMLDDAVQRPRRGREEDSPNWYPGRISVDPEEWELEQQKQWRAEMNGRLLMHDPDRPESLSRPLSGLQMNDQEDVGLLDRPSPEVNRANLIEEEPDVVPQVFGEASLVPMQAASGSISMEVSSEEEYEAPSREQELMADFDPNRYLHKVPANIGSWSPEERARFEESQAMMLEVGKQRYLASLKSKLETKEQPIEDLEPEERLQFQQMRVQADELHNAELAAELPSRRARHTARERFNMKAARRGDAMRGQYAAADRKAARKAERVATLANKEEALPREVLAGREKEESEDSFEIPNIIRGRDDDDDDYEVPRIARSKPAPVEAPPLDEQDGLLDGPSIDVASHHAQPGLLDHPESQGDGATEPQPYDNRLAISMLQSKLRGRPTAGFLTPATRSLTMDAKTSGGGSGSPDALTRIAEAGAAENFDWAGAEAQERLDQEKVAASKEAERAFQDSTGAGIDDAYRKFKAGPQSWLRQDQPHLFGAQVPKSAQPELEPPVVRSSDPRSPAAPADAPVQRGGGWLSKIGNGISGMFKGLWGGLKTAGNWLNPFNAERTQARREQSLQRRNDEIDARFAAREERSRARDAEYQAEEERKMREIPGYREEQEALARKFEAERIENTPDDQLSRDDYMKKKMPAFSSGTAEAKMHEWNYLDRYRVKDFDRKPLNVRKQADLANTAEVDAELAGGSSQFENPHQEEFERQEADIEASRLLAEHPSTQARHAGYQSNLKEMTGTLDYKSGNLAGKLGLTGIQNYFAPPITVSAGYTNRDDEEAQRLQAEAKARHAELDGDTVPQGKGTSEGGGLLDKVGALFSGPSRPPQEFSHVSDEEWNQLSAAEKRKIVSQASTLRKAETERQQADVDSGKSKGIINIGANAMSSIKEVPDSAPSVQMESTEDRRARMNQTKLNNKLEGQRVKRELEKNATAAPEGWADELQNRKDPFQRDVDALKNFFNLGQQPEPKNFWKKFF